MTREEAINEIRTWAIPSEKGREVLETLIPELREKEDENLKNKSGYYRAGKFWKASTLWNATRNKVPQRVPNRYILQECTWNIGTLQDFAKEVKNVQEVSLDYPIILDMNGNILDGAHRVVKAYLEGKDIDIVYIGDDEWPEPDYDEEKAVKESEDERIINQLITLVNSAGEVLLIPTNKEELVAWLNKYKESLHIPETCKENADSFTEDERIRQWLYDLVDEGAYLCERPFATESILAYLERQKEQKPLPPFDEMSPEEKMNHPLYLEGFDTGRKEMTLAEYLKYKMKKFILIFIVAIVLVSLSSCTEQMRTRELGGQMTIELPKGQELMMVTWKDNDLFYLTRPMSPDYVPVTKTFQESASWGVLESTVYFKESR